MSTLKAIKILITLLLAAVSLLLVQLSIHANAQVIYPEDYQRLIQEYPQVAIG
jgi:hypothetical protein